MRSYRSFRVAVCLISLLGAAHAEVIFDNGDTNSLGGLASVGDNGLAADNFMLIDGSNTITGIHWWGYYTTTLADVKAVPLDDFTVFIYADAGGEPGAAPLYTLTDAVTRTDNGTSAFGSFPEFDYVMEIDPLELTPGTTYWLSILNDVATPTKGVPVSDLWFWSFSASDGGDAHQKLAGVWLNTNTELAFQLEGSSVVPEPATFSLVAAGIIAMAARRRSARKS